MQYSQALDFLFSQLPMYQRIGQAAYKANLDNTLAFDQYFESPHTHFKTIHVAGTNGKGSVSHMLASVLQSAGYKTGLYTSPHLLDFRERIKINGEMISESEVVDFVENHNEIIKEIKPSFFEMTVAMAFDYFARQQVEVAVIEVGMGGRLDSTNIINPELSIITNIGLDHTQFLGDTIDKIAAEKAGIIKDGIPVLIGESHELTKPVFIDFANRNNSAIYFADQEYTCDYSMQTLDQFQSFNFKKNGQLVYPDLLSDLLGIYQRKNIATVLKAIDLLSSFNLDKKAIYEGIKYTSKTSGLMGRWQILSYNPTIVCDTGHNKHGLKLVMEQIKQTPHDKLHIVFGAVNDKSIDSILSILPSDAQYYFTKASIPRALDEKELAKKAQISGLKGNYFATVKDAIDFAKKNASANDLIYIGGSTFIVAEAL